MTLKLGAFNDDLHTDFAQAALFAAECGLDGLSVRAVGGRNIASLTGGEVRAIKHAADAAGIEVASIGSQFGRGFHLDDDDAAGAALAHLETALSHADICGTQLVRAFAGWLRGQEALPEWRRRPSYPECLPLLVDRLTPAVRMAERQQAVLMFEIEGASYAGTIAEARLLLDALNSPAVAICWDVCNAWWSGEAPNTGLAAFETVPIVDIHTKDVPARADDPGVASFGRAVVGEGDVGYPHLLPEVIRRGYDGWITAERVHHPLKPEDHPEAQQATLADITALTTIVRKTASS